MKYVSGTIRILVGLVISALTYYVYLNASDEIALHPDAHASVLGHELGINNSVLLNVLIGVGIFGVLVVLFGIATILRKRVPTGE